MKLTNDLISSKRISDVKDFHSDKNNVIAKRSFEECLGDLNVSSAEAKVEDSSKNFLLNLEDISLQECNKFQDSYFSKEKALKLATDTVNNLEILNKNILEGENFLSDDFLNELKNFIDSSHEGFLDPELRQILEEIKTRANVEITKLAMN